jgi:uncharacterized protein
MFLLVNQEHHCLFRFVLLSVQCGSAGQGEAEQLFFNEPLLVVADENHSGREIRIHALGRSDRSTSLLR